MEPRAETTMSARIKPLPLDVAARAASSAVITCLKNVIIGLVCNSLDANADMIEISVDFASNSCIVIDNGVGIPAEEFSNDGNLGKPYCTSKFKISGPFGRNGIFLSSVGALSKLTILSRHISNSKTNSLTLLHSSIVSNMVPSDAASPIRLKHSGTKVSVQRLFENMPIRFKEQTSLQMRRSYSGLLDKLKYDLVAYILAWPSPVSLTLKNKSTPARPSLVFKLQDILDSLAKMDDESLCKISIDHKLDILFRVFHMDPNLRDTWSPVSSISKGLSVQGAISLNSVATRKFQFLAIQSCPLFHQGGPDEIYNNINKVFSKSKFGNVGRSSFCSKGLSTEPRRAHEKKTLDRWPMFFLNIKPLGHGKSWESDWKQHQLQGKFLLLNDALAEVVDEWLVLHGFRSKQFKRPTVDNSDTSNCDVERHIKSPEYEIIGLNCSNIHSKLQSHSATKGPTSGVAERLRASGQYDMRDSMVLKATQTPVLGALSFHDSSKAVCGGASVTFDSTKMSLFSNCPKNEKNEKIEHSSNELTTSGNGQIGAPTSWKDPVTKELYLLNSQTGMIEHPRDLYEAHAEKGSESASLTVRRKKFGTRKLIDGVTQKLGTKSTAISAILDKWANPVFAAHDGSIAAFPSQAIFKLNHAICAASQQSPSSHAQAPSNFLASLSGTKIKVQELADAHVVGQVDNKFILAKVLDTLVLIDQHAADERIRVENLLQELFSPENASMSKASDDHSSTLNRVNSVEINEPLRFQISVQEQNLFELASDHFASWGVEYSISTLARAYSEKTPFSNNRLEVCVKKLPRIIVEQCTQEPSKLENLMRSEVWTRDFGKIRDSRYWWANYSRADTNNQSGRRQAPIWLKHFSECPSKILDLINSRACRSAIMFNDVLTLNECRDLVGRLSKCAFPFQCAHGRPSMISLIHLG